MWNYYTLFRYVKTSSMYKLKHVQFNVLLHGRKSHHLWATIARYAFLIMVFIYKLEKILVAYVVHIISLDVAYVCAKWFELIMYRNCRNLQSSMYPKNILWYEVIKFRQTLMPCLLVKALRTITWLVPNFVYEQYE